MVPPEGQDRESKVTRSMQNQFTIVVSHFIQPGKEQAFEDALKQVIEKAKTYPGYGGIQIFHYQHPTEREYILMIRFDTEANYNIWATSDARNNWFEELKAFITKESEVRFEEGLEFWFSLPEETGAAPPKKWKMAVLTWMVIYPLVLILSTTAGMVLDFWPPYMRILVVSMILVPLMTYVVMPQVTSVFAGWIFKR